MGLRRIVGAICLGATLGSVPHALAGEAFSLEEFLREQPMPIAGVMAEPERYRLQVIYSQIDRDAGGHPTVRSYAYRAGAEYFYPASTVKLPVAVLALEALGELGGVTPDTPMLTLAAGPRLEGAVADLTSPSGLPSVRHYVRKIFAVSDNDAYNRLYELVGQDAINGALDERTYAGVRIVHRLSIFLSEEENRRANGIRFLRPVSGELIAAVPVRKAQGRWIPPNLSIPIGRAEMIRGQRVDGPKDFASKNALPLQALHDMVQALLLPASVPATKRFALADAELSFLRQAMATTPACSGIAAYADMPPDYVKFLLPSGDRERPDLRVFNKVGDAYGFLTDAAYVVDLATGVEFLLAATLYVNDNATFNDDRYQYVEVGFPFLRALGEAVYALERERRVRDPQHVSGLRALFTD